MQPTPQDRAKVIAAVAVEAQPQQGDLLADEAPGESEALIAPPSYMFRI